MPPEESLRTIAWLIAILAVATLLGCGSSSSSNSQSTASRTAPTGASEPAGDTTAPTVRLQNITIQPAKLTIKAGSTVTWRWLDGDIDTPHNVTPLPGGPQFKPSGTRLTGAYSIRFQKPGKYLYECTIHPASMQGEIVVQ